MWRASGCAGGAAEQRAGCHGESFLLVRAAGRGDGGRPDSPWRGGCGDCGGHGEHEHGADDGQQDCIQP